jgi:hypothetical protein
MDSNLSRRHFLRFSLSLAVLLGAAGTAEGVRKGLDLLEQQETWSRARRPNEAFFSENAATLRNLSLGGSFAPEQWPLDDAGQSEALKALDLAIRELGMRQMRLGLRWSRSVSRAGAVDLRPHAPLIERCLESGAELCLNVGPIRTFRWPEEHLPDGLAERTDLPSIGSVIRPESALAMAALDYLDELLSALQLKYGHDQALRTIQIENEPFYTLGAHRWRMSHAYLRELALRVNAAFPGVEVLVTSAGRLNLHSIRDFFSGLIEERPNFSGRLVSGFDFHYRTPLRDSMPLIRHFDQIAYGRPFTASAAEHLRDARSADFRVEVTEGQAEPYGHLTRPGNSAADFRYMVLRCLDKVLDAEEPALIRIWGVEALASRMISGGLTDEHRQIIELIQRVNASRAPQVLGG